MYIIHDEYTCLQMMMPFICCILMRVSGRLSDMLARTHAYRHEGEDKEAGRKLMNQATEASGGTSEDMDE
jgi:hypothetical protein